MTGTEITLSNSLTVLAAKINAAHEAAESSGRRSIEQALLCGDHLLEAKALLAHGQWQDWLAAKCTVSARSARVYMQLARHRPELEAKTAATAIMTIEGAVRYLAPPQVYEPPDPEDGGDIWERARELVEGIGGPFTDFDVADGNLEWLANKISHVARLPDTVDLYINNAIDDGDVLAAVPSDDLVEGIRRLVPFAQQKQEKGAAVVSIDSSDPGAVITIRSVAMRMLGKLLHEMDERRQLSDEEIEHRGNVAHANWMAALDEQIATMESRA